MIYKIREIQINLNANEVFKVFKDNLYSIFLDSSMQNDDIGRYSIILFDPFLTFESKNFRVSIKNNDKVEVIEKNPLDHLRYLFNQYKSEHSESLPFISGCAGYFSYDLNMILDNIKAIAIDDMDIPDIMLGFYNNSITIDHINNKTYITVASSGYDSTENIEKKLEDRIDEIFNRIISSLNDSFKDSINGPSTEVKSKYAITDITDSIQSNFTKNQYMDCIKKIKEYIRNGDVYQINLSQRFSKKLETNDIYSIYTKLRTLNPAPFAAYMNLPEVSVLSSSPERYLKIQGSHIETRPIKGTRPRGKTQEEDNFYKEELLNSIKDSAEHIMIVDLERNDLGRVSEIGSIRPDRLREVEYYATVMHLVSIVKGTLKKDMDFIDCLKATFPGGSITGAPKIRSMEIIDELETCKRNIYTGSIGYIDFNGNCDLNIVIRTIIVKNNTAVYNVGGGIVWDSDPEDEYDETLHKGLALLNTLEG